MISLPVKPTDTTLLVQHAAVRTLWDSGTLMPSRNGSECLTTAKRQCRACCMTGGIVIRAHLLRAKVAHGVYNKAPRGP